MQACFHIAGVTCPNCAYYPQDRSEVTFTQTYEMPQSKFKPENHITGKVYDLTQENMTALILAFEKLSDENARLREALELIAEREGMTQFHDCCVDRSCVPVFFDAEKVANCLFQYGVNRGFNECVSDARAALEGKE